MEQTHDSATREIIVAKRDVRIQRYAEWPWRRVRVPSARLNVADLTPQKTAPSFGQTTKKPALIYER